MPDGNYHKDVVYCHVFIAVLVNFYSNGCTESNKNLLPIVIKQTCRYSPGKKNNNIKTKEIVDN